ncbi:hypothetical protein ABPG72_005382 [Tetrahymena utriculariae]
MFDILVKLNMKCYQKGIPVKPCYKILIKYIKQNALVDTQGIIPVLQKFLIYEQGSVKYQFSEKNHRILLIYFFKITHLNRHIKKIEESFYMRNLDKSLLQSKLFNLSSYFPRQLQQLTFFTVYGFMLQNMKIFINKIAVRLHGLKNMRLRTLHKDSQVIGTKFIQSPFIFVLLLW